jgi:hypothetical protein
MPSRSSQREGRPTLRSERTPKIPTLPPKPDTPETNRGLINISKFIGPSLVASDLTTNS